MKVMLTSNGTPWKSIDGRDPLDPEDLFDIAICGRLYLKELSLDERTPFNLSNWIEHINPDITSSFSTLDPLCEIVDDCGKCVIYRDGIFGRDSGCGSIEDVIQGDTSTRDDDDRKDESDIALNALIDNIRAAKARKITGDN